MPWPSVEPIATADLILEPLRVGHADEMAPVLDDPQLYTFTGGRSDSLAALRQRYRRQVEGRTVDGSQLWFNWVLRHRQTGRPIGFVQATIRVSDVPPVAEMAWVVAAAHQGRGYARQAAEAVVSWLRVLGVSQIIAHIHPDHRASMGVASGIGMKPTEFVVNGEVRWTT